MCKTPSKGGPRLIKLNPTPPSILTLGAHPPWLGYSARILQFAASLAVGGYDRPCGPIESLFLLSPARILDRRARLYSSELSYEALYYSTIYPNSRSPSSLAWVQRTQAELRPNPHLGWPLGLWPSAKSILHCAASLAAVATIGPTGRTRVFFY